MVSFVDADEMTDNGRLKWVLGRQQPGRRASSQKVRAMVRLSAAEINTTTGIQSRSVLAPVQKILPYKPLGEVDADCRSLYAILQLLVRRVNDRITFCWNLKDDLVQNGRQSKRMHEASVLYSYISRIEIELNEIIEPTDMRDRLNYIFLNGLAIKRVTSSLKSRLDRLVTWHAQQAAIEQTKQILCKSPCMFSNSSATGSVLPVKAMKRLFALCICHHSRGGDAQSYSSSQHAEAAIVMTLRSHAIDCVFQPFRDVHRQDIALITHVTGLAVNATVHGVLHTIVASSEQFDEMGVYKLYRILLQLHEVVTELKTELGTTGSRLIEDVTEWRRAEAVVQALNLAVFATSSSKNDASSPRATSDRMVQLSEVASGEGSVAPSVVVLSPSELRRWRGLVHPSKHPFLPRRSRRHRGTVFTTLTFDFDAL